MTLTYTTTDAIGRRLVGRLTIGTATNFGVGSVDADTVQQIGEQVEARVTQRLDAGNLFPLDSVTQLRVTEIVELGICCELLSIYFVNEQESKDGSYTQHCCSNYRQQLDELAPKETVVKDISGNFAGVRQRVSGDAQNINLAPARLGGVLWPLR